MQLNITTDYAIRIILYLSTKQKKITSKELSENGQKKNLFPPLSWNNLYIKFYFKCSIY